MATATGDFVLDFSGVANTNPYTNADFVAYGDGASPSFQVSGGALIIGTGAPSICAFRYEGATASGVTSATVELNRDSTIFNDYDGPALIDTSGNGYWLNTNGDDVRLYRVDSWVATRIGDAINQAFSLNDRITIERDPATNTLTTYLEGVEIESVVDATYTSNLQPAIMKQDNNENAAGVVSFGASGVSTTSLAITEASAEYGDVLNLSTSITDSTSAEGSDGTTTLSLENFTGSSGTYTADLPAIPVGSDGWEPGATITVTITNGVDTATDTITLDTSTGYTEVTATTQDGSLVVGDWGYVGLSGLDAAVTAGDVLWTDAADIGLSDNTDGTTTIDDAETFSGGTVNRYLWDVETSTVSLTVTTYNTSGEVVSVQKAFNGRLMDALSSYTGALPDRLMKYLASEGHTGALPDRIQQAGGWAQVLSDLGVE